MGRQGDRDADGHPSRYRTVSNRGRNDAAVSWLSAVPCCPCTPMFCTRLASGAIVVSPCAGSTRVFRFQSHPDWKPGESFQVE